jgi:hypothetical protein
MSNYTAATVERAFNDFDWDNLEDRENGFKGAILVDGEAVVFEKVASDEGGEYGYGTFLIFKVGTQLFKKSGYYRSHYGNDWDGSFTEVNATTKTVVVYE